MQDTARSLIEEVLVRQRNFFATYESKSLKFRLENLFQLKKVILKYERKITEARWNDLHKSYEDAYLTEISIVVQEIDNHIRHLKKWSKPKRVPTPLHLI